MVAVPILRTPGLLGPAFELTLSLASLRPLSWSERPTRPWKGAQRTAQCCAVAPGRDPRVGEKLEAHFRKAGSPGGSVWTRLLVLLGARAVAQPFPGTVLRGPQRLAEQGARPGAGKTHASKEFPGTTAPEAKRVLSPPQNRSWAALRRPGPRRSSLTRPDRRWCRSWPCTRTGSWTACSCCRQAPSQVPHVRSAAGRPASERVF